MLHCLTESRLRFAPGLFWRPHRPASLGTQLIVPGFSGTAVAPVTDLAGRAQVNCAD